MNHSSVVVSAVVFASVLFGLPLSAPALPVLYGSLDESANGGPSSLVTIDVTSGAVHEVGDLGANIKDMAFDIQTQTLYGIDGGTGDAQNALYNINRSTGTASSVNACRSRPMHDGWTDQRPWSGKEAHDRRSQAGRLQTRIHSGVRQCHRTRSGEGSAAPSRERWSDSRSAGAGVWPPGL